MELKDIGFGDILQDEITGFTGKCIAKAEHCTGCHQLLVQPPLDNGKFMDPLWFDIERITIKEPAHTTPTSKRSGGPRGPSRQTR